MRKPICKPRVTWLQNSGGQPWSAVHWWSVRSERLVTAAPRGFLSPLHPPAFSPMPGILLLDVVKGFSFQESSHIKPDTPKAVVGGGFGGGSTVREGSFEKSDSHTNSY